MRDELEKKIYFNKDQSVAFEQFLLDCSAFKSIFENSAIGCGKVVQKKFDQFWEDLPPDRDYSKIVYQLALIVLRRFLYCKTRTTAFKETKLHFYEDKNGKYLTFNEAEQFSLLYLIRNYPPFKYGFSNISPYNFELVMVLLESQISLLDHPPGKLYYRR